MKTQTKLLIALTIINLVLVGCGAISDATASGSFRLTNLYGYECITNDVALWCR